MWLVPSFDGFKMEVLEKVRSSMKEFKDEVLESVKDEVVDSTVDRIEVQMKDLVADQLRGINTQLSKEDEDRLVDRLRRRLKYR